MSNNKNLGHVQTLVEMNHCVETARRDAAFDCLEKYVEGIFDIQDSKERLNAYKHCIYLVNEAVKATKDSSPLNDRQSVYDRPAVHFMKLMLELSHALAALANHVSMVEQEDVVLKEAMDEKTLALLVSTCQEFQHTEKGALESFCKMFPVGRTLLEMSTSKHCERFGEDDERRYHVAYEEFKMHYSETRGTQDY